MRCGVVAAERRGSESRREVQKNKSGEAGGWLFQIRKEEKGRRNEAKEKERRM